MSIFSPIGVTKKKNKKHKRIIRKRAYYRRKHLPVHQDIATFVVTNVCRTMNISRPLPEAPIYAEYTRRWYLRDIYVPDLKLVIEIDGSSHNSQVEYDKARDEGLRRKGIKTVRFKNEETMNLAFRGKIENVFRDRLKEINTILYYQIEDLSGNILQSGIESLKKTNVFANAFKKTLFKNSCINIYEVKDGIKNLIRSWG